MAVVNKNTIFTYVCVCIFYIYMDMHVYMWVCSTFTMFLITMQLIANMTTTFVTA